MYSGLRKMKLESRSSNNYLKEGRDKSTSPILWLFMEPRFAAF